MRNTVVLRPATGDDSDFLRALRNEMAVVAASRSDQHVDQSTHQRWLETSIESPTRRLFVAWADDVAIGQARLDLDPEGEWVSLAITEPERGRGYGTEVLAELQRLALGDLLAEVRVTNLASRTLFRQAGFHENAHADGFVALRWRNSSSGAGALDPEMHR
jgi:RimJ/RimL family protein N-acetyltransferase